MRLLFICKGFNKNNLNKQPWRYFYELIKYSASFENNIEIFTDSKDLGLKLDNIKIKILPSVNYLKLNNSKLFWKYFHRFKPEICILLLGTTSPLYNKFFRNIKVKKIGIFTSTVYNPSIMFRLNLFEIFNEYKYWINHFIGSILPKKMYANLIDNFDKIVTLTKENKYRLKSKSGLVNTRTIEHIPTGIDSEFIELAKKEEFNGKTGRFLYFGPIISIRGVFDILDAFKLLIENNPSEDYELIFLSRLDRIQLKNSELKLFNKIKQEKLTSKVKIISKNFEKEELVKFLSTSKVILLPFKVFMSDFPITVLEVFTLGKPLISYHIVGLTEYFYHNKGNLIELGNKFQMSNYMKYWNDHDETTKINPIIPTWDEIGKYFYELICAENTGKIR